MYISKRAYRVSGLPMWQVSAQLKLPVLINKFLQPVTVSANDFVARWRALAGPPLKLQEVVSISPSYFGVCISDDENVRSYFWRITSKRNGCVHWSVEFDVQNYITSCSTCSTSLLCLSFSFSWIFWIVRHCCFIHGWWMLGTERQAYASDWDGKFI